MLGKSWVKFGVISISAFGLFGCGQGASPTVFTPVVVQNPVVEPPASKPEKDSLLSHYGVPVDLVGANLAWSEDSRFGTDIGKSTTNLPGFEVHFDNVKAAGGNSVRIWLHTSAQVTPKIQADGYVVGLSGYVSNDVVVDQLKSILDAAWDRGLLVTFSLFSFDMLCDTYGDDYGYNGVWQLESHRIMMENYYQSYIDNALLPMVSGVKDHPAMFAWEVFNEADGMIYDPHSSEPIEEYHFCQSDPISDKPISYPLSINGAQSFVNHVAAAIHGADPNVKVTTSFHTDYMDVFLNSALIEAGGQDTGTLDFYEVHHYPGYANAPYTTSADVYGVDKPIIVGEYNIAELPAGVEATESISMILDQGYAGAWPWSLNGKTAQIQDAISNVSEERRYLDVEGIEACLVSRDIECYKY